MTKEPGEARRKQASGQSPLDIHPDVDVVSATNSIGGDKPAMDTAHSRTRFLGFKCRPRDSRFTLAETRNIIAKVQVAEWIF